MGNTRFKSSTNRAPRKTTPGGKGEVRNLRLELKVLADVGLLGFPNAGKSTLIRSVSAAKPKVADYPFTTLIPNLGVVKIGRHKSFVMADIPGIIEGAAEGAGLGIRFLKHLARTRFLLHLVDVYPVDGSDPVEAVRVLESELFRFSSALAERPRWLVLNKTDLMDEATVQALMDRMEEELEWEGPIYTISAVTGAGTEVLVQDLMKEIEEYDLLMEEDEEFAQEERERLQRMEEEAREKVQEIKQQKKAGEEDDDWDEDEYDVEFEYKP